MIFQGKITTRNNQQRYEEKKKTVLLWIAQFDFSSLELLSAILHQHKDNTSLFFRRLIAEGYLVPFKAANLHRDDLVRVGFEGVTYLKDNFGIDVRRKMRSDEIARRKKLFHDYCLQVYIAEFCSGGLFYSVLSEKNISRARGKAHRIPDALLFDYVNNITAWNVSKSIELPDEIKELRHGLEFFDEEGFWCNPEAPIAIEIEVTPKNKKQAMPVFKNLLIQIQEGKLSQVRFIFDDPKICNRYKVWLGEIQFSHWKLPLQSPYRDSFKFEVVDFEFRWLLALLDDDPRDWDLAHP